MQNQLKGKLCLTWPLKKDLHQLFTLPIEKDFHSKKNVKTKQPKIAINDCFYLIKNQPLQLPVLFRGTIFASSINNLSR